MTEETRLYDSEFKPVKVVLWDGRIKYTFWRWPIGINCTMLDLFDTEAERDAEIDFQKVSLRKETERIKHYSEPCSRCGQYIQLRNNGSEWCGCYDIRVGNFEKLLTAMSR